MCSCMWRGIHDTLLNCTFTAFQAKCLPQEDLPTTWSTWVFSWDSVFNSKFDPSAPALHIAGVDNVYLPYQILGISFGVFVVANLLAAGISFLARRSSCIKRKTRFAVETKKQEKEEEKRKNKKEEEKGAWMKFRPNMYDAFAASALYQDHEISLVRA